MRLVDFLAFMLLVTFSSMASAAPSYMTATGKVVGDLEIFRDCDVCPEMVVLPAGDFTMGSTRQEAWDAHRRFFRNSNIDPDEADVHAREYAASIGVDPDADPTGWLNPFLNELPAHRVVMDLPVAMGRNEVTRKEWAACVADGGCTQDLMDLPAEQRTKCLNTSGCVMSPDDRIRFRLRNGPYPTNPWSPRTAITYREMLEYTAWLNTRIGAPLYRLPTEAEWEYAARAGSSTPFSGGKAPTLRQANYLVSRLEIVDGKPVWNYHLGSALELLPVDSLDAANAWGLRHMAGNASEMTGSCDAGPQRELATDSQYLAADAGRSCDRSVKGGFYGGDVELLRPARRVATPEDHWSDNLGFRVIRDLAPAD